MAQTMTHKSISPMKKNRRPLDLNDGKVIEKFSASNHKRAPTNVAWAKLEDAPFTDKQNTIPSQGSQR